MHNFIKSKTIAGLANKGQEMLKGLLAARSIAGFTGSCVATATLIRMGDHNHLEVIMGGLTAGAGLAIAVEGVQLARRSGKWFETEVTGRLGMAACGVSITMTIMFPGPLSFGIVAAAILTTFAIAVAGLRKTKREAE